MKAKVVKAFPGRPDNEVMTRTVEVGEIIDGELAAVAMREKWAQPYRDPAETEAEKKKAPKRRRPRQRLKRKPLKSAAAKAKAEADKKDK
jgi:hypothetical protein